MPSTMNPDCLLCGLRFGNKPLLDLHIREDHRQPVPRAQDGHLDPGSTRARASRADGPPHGHDLASAPSRITKEATARTTRRRRRAGRAITALRGGLRAIRCVSDELLRASGASSAPPAHRSPARRRLCPRPGRRGKPNDVPSLTALTTLTARIALSAGPVLLSDDCARQARS